MTALLLRVPCPHGKWEAHPFIRGFSCLDAIERCPGGREPTVEEVKQWATKHDLLLISVSLFEKASGHDRR